MKIILLEDITNLGYKDEIVTVKDGYGRNYLIPTGKAIVATPHAIKQVNENLKQKAHKLAKIKEEAQAIADKLKELSLTIGAKTSSAGTIFGAVTNIQIAEALEKAGFNIDRKSIIVKGVKEIGNYSATIKLHKDIIVELPFDVVSE